MTNPFTIRIFVPEGDPEGIRIIDRLSSTGIFFAFPRDKWQSIKNRPELLGSGIYILSGYANPDDDLPTTYVGQADTVFKRINSHIKEKDFWDKAVVFVSANKLNSTHAKWLEQALIRRLNDAQRSKIENGNSPIEPTISEAEKADMEVFLTEIYQTLPLVGVRAFEYPRNVSVTVKTSSKSALNTIIVPAKEDGFREVFLGEDSWYAIRIAGGKLDQIKYIASYRSSPISAVTHIAEVDRIEPYGEEGKYKLIFTGKAVELGTPVKFDLSPGAMQSPRYANKERLEKADNLSEVFN